MSAPKDYELIATLWYLLDGNAQAVVYETNPFLFSLSAIDYIVSLYTNPEDPLGFGPLGNDFTISYSAVRTPVNNPNSAITLPSYKETFFINVPAGSIEGTSVYYDTGTGLETTVDENIFTISGGRGLFHDAAIAIIKYDNDGSIFGIKGSRRVEVFKLRTL
jgi:hypothetical protein